MRILLIAALLYAALLQGWATAASSISVDSDSSIAMYNHRFHVFFTGKVQGVGFRQTLRTYALELQMVGWVKNLEDQRVEMVVEGPEPEFNLLVGKMCSEFKVSKAEVKKEKADGRLSGFEIIK